MTIWSIWNDNYMLHMTYCIVSKVIVSWAKFTIFIELWGRSIVTPLYCTVNAHLYDNMFFLYWKQICADLFNCLLIPMYLNCHLKSNYWGKAPIIGLLLRGLTNYRACPKLKDLEIHRHVSQSFFVFMPLSVRVAKPKPLTGTCFHTECVNKLYLSNFSSGSVFWSSTVNSDKNIYSFWQKLFLPSPFIIFLPGSWRRHYCLYVFKALKLSQ